MPLPTIIALLTWSILAWWAARRWLPTQRWVQHVLLVPMVVLALFFWPFTNNLMAGWLEGLPSPPESCRSDPPAAIVILPSGTAHSRQPELLWSSLLPGSAMRLGDGLELAARTPADTVFFSGNGKEARLFDEVRGRLNGLEQARFVTDDEGYTTHRAALRARQLIADVDRIFLVTSAMHMTRARLTFEKQGFAVCPYPVGPWAEPEPRPWWVFPNGRTIVRADSLLHELVGLAWYWATDRI